MGGSKRGLSGSGEAEPIDVDSLPEKDFSRENRRIRRRMTSQPEKSVSSQPNPSSPSSGSTQKIHVGPDSDLHDCPITNDSGLSGDVPPEPSVPGVIVKFNPPSFGIPPRLVRTVDLPFDSAAEEKKKSSSVLPRPVDKTTGGKLSSHSAFRWQMFGAASETKLSEVVEENRENVEALPDPPVISMEGNYNQPLLCTYIFAPFLFCLSVVFGPSSGGDEKKPGFMAFADALPGFLRPFAPMKFPATPFPVEVSIEEAMERARTLFLEGMSCVHGVVIRSQARDVHYEI